MNTIMKRAKAGVAVCCSLDDVEAILDLWHIPTREHRAMPAERAVEAARVIPGLMRE